MTTGAAGGGVSCRHISCCGSDRCIRRPRRTRAQVDADTLDTMLDRWKHRLTDEEYDSGLLLLQSLRELEQEAR